MPIVAAGTSNGCAPAQNIKASNIVVVAIAHIALRKTMRIMTISSMSKRVGYELA